MLGRLTFLAVVVALVGAVAPPAVAARRKDASARPDPVLLVHGFRGSSNGWQALEASLRAQGYRDSEFAAMDYDDDASNVDVAHEIAQAADALRARTGASHIAIVSHSMGAISSRYYMERLGGATHVGAFVTLGGVNQGTIWAYACYILTPCREMVPSSSVLHQLNDAFHPEAVPTRYAAWWSPCDQVIVPQANAELHGARNVETACLGHSSLRTDPVVLGQVVRFLSDRSVAF